MDKWFAIVLAVFVIGMFSPVIVSEHSKSQCRIEAIKAGIDADKIATACGLNK